MKPPLAIRLDAGGMREAHCAGAVIARASCGTRLVEVQCCPAAARISTMRGCAGFAANAGELIGAAGEQEKERKIPHDVNAFTVVTTASMRAVSMMGRE